MAELILSKTSDSAQLKQYFTGILKMSQSGQEFPINLDDVWPLCYENRNKAVEWLRANFIQTVDYETIARKRKASNAAGYVMAKDYMLTVSCMEYFVARKVRAVFEVYRQVFHGVANGALPSYQISDPIKRAEAWIVEQKQRQELEAVNIEQKRQLEANRPKVAFADAITSSSSSCLIGELAKLIRQAVERQGRRINIGQNRFFQWLRDNGFLGRSAGYYNVANQTYIEKGLFELKHTVHDENGELVTKTTTKVTGRGQSYFINGFLDGRFVIR